jgi:hypothetical protein
MSAPLDRYPPPPEWTPPVGWEREPWPWAEWAGAAVFGLLVAAIVVAVWIGG